MKKFIQKINTFLIEKYPILWNTKIVWFLSISLLLHLLFFMAGFITINDVTLLQKNDAKNLFLSSGTVFFGIIISILQIIIWLIFLFKNNAFKEFYPTKKSSLFFQFIIYFFCFFISSSYYFSYDLGLKTSVLNKYPKEVILADIETANNASLFFSHNILDYTINNIKYPAPFDSLYCESNQEKINLLQPHLIFKKKFFQFYTLSKEEYLHKNNIPKYQFGQVYIKQTDSSVIRFYKDTVIDVSSLIKTVSPSYFNFSNTFYTAKYYSNAPPTEDSANNLIFYDEYNSALDNDLKERFETNKYGHQLLEKRDAKLVSQKLQDFLQLAEKYKINYNISLQQWMDIVYHPDAFELKAIIRDEPKSDIFYNNDIQVAEFGDNSELGLYENELKTDYYIETQKLYNVFWNIEDISSTNIIDGIFIFLLWLSFLLASILFAFRVTGLKPLLFAIILGGVLITLAALITVIFDFVEANFDLIIQYTLLAMLGIIFITPVFFLKKVRKSVQGVFLVLTITNFTSIIFLIISIISSYQRISCLEMQDYNNTNKDCLVLIEYLGFENVGYIILLFAMVFMYIYTTIIKKWRALPES